MASEGSREIEAAKRRLAAAKLQASSANQMVQSARSTLESLQKSIQAAKKNLHVAETQVEQTRKEVEAAEKYVAESEKRWEVIDINDEDDDNDDDPDENNLAKRRKCELNEEQQVDMLRKTFSGMEKGSVSDDMPIQSVNIVMKKIQSILGSNPNWRTEFTAKAVRKMLEEWLGIDLSDHKDIIRSILMDAMKVYEAAHPECVDLSNDE